MKIRIQEIEKNIKSILQTQKDIKNQQYLACKECLMFMKRKEIAYWEFMVLNSVLYQWNMLYFILYFLSLWIYNDIIIILYYIIR